MTLEAFCRNKYLSFNYSFVLRVKERKKERRKERKKERKKEREKNICKNVHLREGEILFS